MKIMKFHTGIALTTSLLLAALTVAVPRTPPPLLCIVLLELRCPLPASPSELEEAHQLREG